MEKTVLSPNTRLQGRYRIFDVLGHGGMGVVYQAVDENLQCHVAIKETFATDADKEQRRAFEHEARLLANIRHPALPRVTNYFEQGDGLFFVMDLIRGDDLAKRLELRGRPFAVEDVLKWADTLLAALVELHAVNPPIVHKDIKPSNIKLWEGKIYLLDFGLAKGAFGQMSTVQSHDYSHLQGHTPHFSSPEQRARSGTSPRSDLYSLGATLWCLLTNGLPPDSVLRNYAVHNGDPDPLRPAHQLNPDVPPAVSAVLEQAMSLNPMRRPPSAVEMRAALREAVEAPLRAKAERERAEEEERIRREGKAAGRAEAEAEFAGRLEKERAAHAAAVRRLKEEHRSALAQAQADTERVRAELSRSQAVAEGHEVRARVLAGELASERKLRAAAESKVEAERGLRLRREEDFCYLEDRLKKTEDELQSARHAREAAVQSGRERSERADGALREMEASLEAKDGALKAAEELTRKLAVEKDTAVQDGKRLDGLLAKGRLALRDVERERDAAQQAVKSAKSQLARLKTERSSRDRVLHYAGVGAAVLLTSITLFALVPWVVGLFASPAVTVSPDKLKVSIGEVALETVNIPGGTFTMGASDKEVGRHADEKPTRQVTVPAFNMGKYEVTQAQWRAVSKLPKIKTDLKDSPSDFKGDNLPVEAVSWDEAVEFCARLSAATGLKYRLPTEAEWEYAARGGASAPFVADPDPLAWTTNNSGKQQIDAPQLWSSVKYENKQYQAKLTENGNQTHPVGQKQGNAFGLYDMLGNVREWCLDVWHEDYKGAPSDGSEWVAGGDSTLRVNRGGSWFNFPVEAHPAERFSAKSDMRFADIGFRVVSVP